MVQYFLQCISNVSVNHLVIGLEFISKEGGGGWEWARVEECLRALTGHRKWLAKDGNWIQWWDL